jgi:hypothetical protein
MKQIDEGDFEPLKEGNFVMSGSKRTRITHIRRPSPKSVKQIPIIYFDEDGLPFIPNPILLSPGIMISHGFSIDDETGIWKKNHIEIGTQHSHYFLVGNEDVHFRNEHELQNLTEYLELKEPSNLDILKAVERLSEEKGDDRVNVSDILLAFPEHKSRLHKKLSDMANPKFGVLRYFPRTAGYKILYSRYTHATDPEMSKWLSARSKQE